MALTKREIVENVADKTGFTFRESLGHFEAVLKILKDNLASGNKVKISGFGTFEVKQKKARKGRNPQTGEPMIIENRRILTYKPSFQLRKKINGLGSNE